MVAAVAAACDNEKPRWHRNKRLALLQSVIGGFIENIRRRISCGYFSLVGQSFSALGASSLQDISAVSGFHSLSEAVLLFSLTLFRLISSKHFGCTSFNLNRKRFAFQLNHTLLHNDILYYTRSFPFCQVFFKKNNFLSQKNCFFLTKRAYVCYNRKEYEQEGGSQMEILRESDFRRELKGTPRAGYLFFGEEDYLKSHAIRTAEELLSPDPTFSFFNVMKLDALDFTPDKLLDALMPMPMMTDRKLVTLTGLNLITMRPNELDALCDALTALESYDYNLLILSVSADCFDAGYLPKRPSATLKRLAQYLTPVQFERITPARLAAWAQKHFAHNGVNASPALCANMIDYCGRSMFSLANEIDKLSYYELFHGRSEATEADMHLVCTSVTEYDIFSFANAVMEGRQDVALSILADYKLRRVDPLVILGEVIRVFCDMEGVQAMTADGASPQEIASTLNIHDFRVGLYQKSLRQSPESRLSRAIAACVSADTSLKLSPQGYTALERLICSI